MSDEPTDAERAAAEAHHYKHCPQSWHGDCPLDELDWGDRYLPEDLAAVRSAEGGTQR